MLVPRSSAYRFLNNLNNLNNVPYSERAGLALLIHTHPYTRAGYQR
jgi:hypothetical protein